MSLQKADTHIGMTIQPESSFASGSPKRYPRKQTLKRHRYHALEFRFETTE